MLLELFVLFGLFVLMEAWMGKGRLKASTFNFRMFRSMLETLVNTEIGLFCLWLTLRMNRCSPSEDSDELRGVKIKGLKMVGSGVVVLGESVGVGGFCRGVEELWRMRMFCEGPTILL